VRWGQVYRTGALGTLTSHDWQKLNEMGLKLVCDLRSTEEQSEAPDNIPGEWPAYKHLPLKAELDTWKRMRTIMFSPQSVPQMLTDSYTQIMIDQNPQVFGQVLRYIAESDNLPAVIHCTAGKDRTGVTIALLLSLLGVSDDIIVADYTLSNRYFSFFHAFAQKSLAPIRWLQVTADDVYPLLIANAETISATLAYVRAQHGSVETYLRDYAGVDEATQSRLRELLLTDHPEKP
jgi:protein-tyrosine phosphatase